MLLLVIDGLFQLREGKALRMQSMHGENSSLDFIEAVYPWYERRHTTDVL